MTMTNNSGKSEEDFVNSLTTFMKDDKLQDMLDVNEGKACKSVIPLA